MPVTKRIIKHVGVEIARGARRCRRDGSHTIRPGMPCLTIHDEGTPFKRNYCDQCALPILKQCASDLRDIRDALYPEGIPKPVPAKEAGIGDALVAKNQQSRTKTAEKKMAVTSEAVQEVPIQSIQEAANEKRFATR